MDTSQRIHIALVVVDQWSMTMAHAKAESGGNICHVLYCHGVTSRPHNSPFTFIPKCSVGRPSVSQDVGARQDMVMDDLH